MVRLHCYFPLYSPYIPLYSSQYYYKIITGKPCGMFTQQHTQELQQLRIILGCVHQVLMNQTTALGQQQGILITTSTHFKRKYQLSLLKAVIITPLGLP